MAFVLSNLTATSHGSQKNMTHQYSTSDNAAAVEGAGYFNAAATYVEVGDNIDVSLDWPASTKRKDYVVTANTGTVVTVAAQTTA